MNSESRMLLAIWSIVEDQIAKSQRVDAAMGILRAFDEYGLDLVEFQEAGEEDNYLEAALNALVEDDESIDNEYGE